MYVNVCICLLPSGGLEKGLYMMVSSVQGPLDEGTAGNPGIRQANMRSCSSAQLLCRASSQSRKRRMPSQRIYTHKHKHHFLSLHICNRDLYSHFGCLLIYKLTYLERVSSVQKFFEYRTYKRKVFKQRHNQ